MHRKQWIVLMWVVIGSLVGACHKQESWRHPDQLSGETIIEGHVRDPWGEPVVGALVRCMVTSGTPYRNTWNYWLPAVTTDSTGYYRFHHADTRDVFQYDIMPPLLDGYYEGGIKFAGPNYRMTIDFELRPHAWIRVHFKNVDPVGPNDLIIWNISSFYLQKASFLGTSIDESWTFKGAGGALSPMIWWVTKNGIQKEYRDTVILPKHDTLFYSLEY